MLPYQRLTLIISVVLSALFFSTPVFARMVTQMTPTLTITEEYSDNYFQDADNTQEEYITSFGLGFSVGFLNKTSKIYLGYNPEYKVYKNLDDRDGLYHNASLDSEFNLTKYTNLYANLAYTSDSDNEAGNSWENTASISGDSQLTKNTGVNLSQTYSRSYDQQDRTGDYSERETHRTSAGISNQFGEKDRMGLNFIYQFNDYDEQDEDAYKEYTPSGFITYWLTPLDGIESNFSFEKKDFENPTSNNDDMDTYEGDIRYIRTYSKHFDGFVKYRHTYSQRDSGDHTIYHPSVGFDWDVTEDSGISLGIGVLVSEWDNDNDDSVDPFLEIDAYKVFDFSRRGSLSITGSSGYDESSDDAASLGYHVYYRAGFQLNYKLQKRLSSYVNGSYQTEDYKEDAADRKDTTTSVGGGLSWDPLKWLRFNLSYTYTDFNTDTDERGDYTENSGEFSVSFIPQQPVRVQFSPSRQSLENDIFVN